ncbi:AAA family ATPase [Candidatus Contubernalis alkalaceticus]|nr:AAA family ATPase [Candidatus Contubernalis alkalaceticus]
MFRGLESGEISAGQVLRYMKDYDSQLRNGSQENSTENIANIAIILQQLDQLIGLQRVKTLVKEAEAYIEIQRRRQFYNLNNESLVLHMIFTGNPGTGKTTVARILGELFKEMKVLPQGHLVEVERADLVGEYIGHTAQRTREQIKKAIGGILFVDEAYSLARGGQKDFGKEAIDTMVKAMEDYKTEFILILAGYPREMAHFLTVNPGLKSRFPIHLDFPDYSQEELLAIAELMLKNRQYRLSGEARVFLKGLLDKKDRKNNFSNARFMRNLIEQSIRRQALRLVRKKETTRDELMLIAREDIRLEIEEEVVGEELTFEKLFGDW